jgi:DNA adenine methylase
MNYMGGKHRQGPKIATFIEPYMKPGLSYVEPFCGAMGTAWRILPLAMEYGIKDIWLSDSNEALINMWRALLDGWEPPDIVTEETYQYYKKNRDPKDPMTAYCGYGMSFGSKWWGGYARNKKGTNFAANLQRSTLLKTNTLLKTKFKLKCCDYQNIPVITNSIIYLDPPYTGRCKAHGVVFNHDGFWAWAEKLIEQNNTVFITELLAPEPWERVFNFGNTVVGHYAGKPFITCESIFMHRSQI